MTNVCKHQANIETSQNENVQANSTNPNRSSMEEDSSSRGTSVDDSHSHSSRFRRLVSQSTFHENDLDNAVLNSQQQFIDLSDSSDSDDEDPDQLFEEYLRRTEEVVRSQARLFDDELPMNHSYLGATDVVRGTNCFEPGQVYEIPVCEHHSLVFPGEIFPMIMSNESIFARTPVSNEGITFGLIFADETDKYDRIYGVTCHVFEKGLDAHGHITVKSKADQRFVVVKDEDGLPSIRNHIFYAKVKILPEFELPEPINLSLSNYMMKFLHNPSQSAKLKVLLTSCNRWPQFVYDQYSIVTVNEKVERFLAMLSISAPSEPTLKSFWLARNVPLNQAERMKIFTSNCVNERMLLIGKSLTYVSYILLKSHLSYLTVIQTYRCVSSTASAVRVESQTIQIFSQWPKATSTLITVIPLAISTRH